MEVDDLLVPIAAVELPTLRQLRIIDVDDDPTCRTPDRLDVVDWADTDRPRGVRVDTDPSDLDPWSSCAGGRVPR